MKCNIPKTFQHSRCSSGSKAKMAVRYDTVKRWRTEFDVQQEWMLFEDEGGFVKKIRCGLCTKHEGKLKYNKNFNAVWSKEGITGTSLKKDTVTKHVRSDAHCRAVNLEKKPASVAELYQTPLGKAFHSASKEELDRISKLIDICYLLAVKEKPLSMYVDIAEQEKRHGVKLGQTYLTDKMAAVFSSCIGEVGLS